MSDATETLAVFEVQFSYYDSNRNWRPTGKRWVLATDLQTAISLVLGETARLAIAIHSVQKRTGDLWGHEKLIVDWDSLDAYRRTQQDGAA